MKKLFIILALILALPSFSNAQRKRAMLVGISKYHSYGYKVWGNIHGAEDVALLAPELKKKGFAVQTLTNDQATYQGILSSLDKLIVSAKNGDIVYLHFSCHGQPIEDGLNGMPKEEKDGWDESLVPIDAGKVYGAAGYKGEKHLTDDILNRYITKLRKKIGYTGMLYVAMDACHAGTMSKGGLETIRGTKDGFSSKPNAKYNPPESNIKHFHVQQGTGISPVLFIEACKSYERNSEIFVKGKEYGSLSYNVWQALKSMSSFDKSSRETFKAQVKASTEEKGRWPRNQTLVIEE